MPALRNRSLEVQIDTTKIVGVRAPALRVLAKATKTLKKEPNTCEVSVYNLTPDHRAALTKIARPVVTVTAGYDQERTQLFLGQALHVQHERRGPDIVTTVSTSDGGDKLQKARVHQSFGPGGHRGWPAGVGGLLLLAARLQGQGHRGRNVGGGEFDLAELKDDRPAVAIFGASREAHIFDR